jgi:hypothetical protein
MPPIVFFVLSLVFLAMVFVVCVIWVGFADYRRRTVNLDSLIRYLRYVSNAIQPGSSVYARTIDHKRQFHFFRPTAASEQSDLYLRIRSSTFERNLLTTIADAADSAGLDNTRYFTRKLKKLREVRFGIDVSGTSGIARAKRTIELIANAAKIDLPLSFVVVYRGGRFQEGFEPGDGETVPRAWTAERIGYAFGWIVGEVVRIVKRDR